MNPVAPIKFPLGKIVIAPAALKLLSPEDIRSALDAHLSGEWGDLGKEDRAENDRALIQGHRLLSVYHNDSGTKFWVITEADRSVTNVYLRETDPVNGVGRMVSTRTKDLVRRLNKLTAKPVEGARGIKLRFCVR